MSKSMKRILVFLGLTFGLMYGSHGLIALLLETTEMEWGSFLYDLLGILGGGAPAFAALIMISTMYGKEEREAYWKRVYHYRTGTLWWAVALLSPLVIGFGGNLLHHGGWWNPGITPGELAALPLAFGTMIFAGGAEELGWRGVLQETMKKTVSLPVMGLVIGILWGIWHGPLFMIDVFAHSGYAFSTYLLSTIAFSLLLTLVVYKTGSVLLAILLHAGINAFGNLGFGIPMEASTAVMVYLVVISVIMGGVLYSLEKKKKGEVRRDFDAPCRINREAESPET